VTDDVRAFPALPGSLPKIDTGLANVARAWNYMVGGKDNFEADREAARQLMEVAPVIRIAAPASRAFVRRAVRYLAGDAGIRQFLDIGTGLPTAGNTHEIAQAVAPECRVVYVDNDPVVLVHARALLTSDPAGVTSYIDADARDPDTIVSQAGATLDLAEPVAIIMLDVQDFEFLVAVAVGDHRHRQVGIRGEFGGQVAERSGGEARGPVPDLLSGRAAENGPGDADHASSSLTKTGIPRLRWGRDRAPGPYGISRRVTR
jgi:hypothetical protein